MSEEVIDALLVKLGVTVDQASFEESTQAVNGLDNAINKAARDRGKTGLDRIGKNMADTGAGARAVEQGIDKFGKAVDRVPRSVNVLQTRLGSATQQMASFRKETQAAVALLSRGAGAAGLGPLSGSLFSMLAGGGPIALAAAGIGGLAANSFSYANGALSTEVSASTYGVSKSDFQNFNRFGKKITGEDDVGTQILQAAQRIKVGSQVGNIPIDIARYGGVPADFADAFRRPTMDVVDTIKRQLGRVQDPVQRQGIASSLGLNQPAIMTLEQDYRTGIKQSDKPGSTYTDQDVANARAFENSLVDLTADFDRLRNKLGADFLPSLDNFVKRVDGMFAQGGIADRITQFADHVGKGDMKGAVDVLKDKNVQSAVSGFVQGHVPILDIAKGAYKGGAEGWDKGGAVGAYKGAVTGYFRAIGDQFPAARNLVAQGYDSAQRAVYDKMPSAHVDDDVSKPLRPEFQARLQQAPAMDQPAPLAQGSQSDAQQRALKFFMDNGYTREQSSGMVANLVAESGLKTDAVGDNGQAYGLAQWHPERQKEFKDFFGKDIKGSSEQDQLNFILYELQNKEKSAGEALLKTKSPSQSASVMREMYERPADNPADANLRMQIAEQLNSGQVPNAESSPKGQVQAIESKVPALAGSSKRPVISYEMLPQDDARLPSPPALPGQLGSPQYRPRQFQGLGNAQLPGDIPDTYNMVANPPAPPSIDLTQSQPQASEGNTVHIDARGSTDVHKITSEALRAASDHFQGQMTVAMSHLSTDLDQ
ncbi:phage tail tip lysozyme [Pseudomonas sp. App30]|uniref:phage tail tip lysozyme n=1 Tax=Pseudomonas sp. App30 TaxID=3068990 RepID=UPI003A8080EE